jgi:BirA family biotin operon repressor/biotin-[acetyl-CoA-carboxylase] ligase
MAARTDSAALTTEAISALLHTEAFGRTLHILPVTASTNSEAMALAQRGASEGTVVLAEEQTAGKGRLGRRWHSPPGENLYCSVVMRYTKEAGDISRWLSWLPLQSAVAVAKTVQSAAGLTPSLKWPNDIMIGARKLGGLLCESSAAGSAETVVVVGIGLNVNSRLASFPADLQGTATSLAAETGRSFDRASVLAALLSELELCARRLRFESPAHLIDTYSRLCSTLGQHVRVTLAADDTLEGLADSIGPDGALRILSDGPPGRIVELRAGDVVHLRSKT